MILIKVSNFFIFINLEMYSIVELIGIYGETKAIIIRNKLFKKTNRYFNTITNILLGLKDNLEHLPVEFQIRPNSSNMRF